jgi:hypothetical protein
VSLNDIILLIIDSVKYSSLEKVSADLPENCPKPLDSAEYSLGITDMSE